MPDEDSVEADAPQDLGETVFGESANIEIVVARFPFLITDDFGDSVDQIGVPVIEDGNDMDDGRLLATGANGHAELNTRKHFVQATIPLPLFQGEVEVLVKAVVVGDCAHVDVMRLQTAKQRINMAFIAAGKFLLAFVLCGDACSRMDMQIDSGWLRDYAFQLHLLCCPGELHIAQR